ncbi:MAG: thioredoxin domain-containing protein [Candidatus Sericytochromatia bacterium]|nr:thioredoxin domain-containing protein [Candidatus Sericytochromatia bacterium]
MPATLVTCPRCQARNRLQPGRAGAPTCGACHAPLPAAPAQPLDATDATFDSLALGAPGPVLVDVWAPWCGPCRMQAPALEAVAAAHGERLRVVKLNADENPRTTAALGVQGLPTLLLLRGGQVVARRTGLTPEPHLTTWLREAGAL